MAKCIGLSFNYPEDKLNDGIFSGSPGLMENRIRVAFEERGVEVHTIDRVDPKSDDTIAVIFFDFNWRHWLHDRFLKGIPFEKRVFVSVEPANINPTAYYISFFRNHFSKVFTYDEILLKKNPTYIPHTVLPFGEFETYKTNKWGDIPFSEKKLLCSITMNRWSYMPQSTYGLRKSAYRWFEDHHPDDFDLYGHLWNQPVIFYERWFGYPKFTSYRGAIDGPYSRKMEVMARYKFALCFENNAARPGYISEKIRDCFCSRTIPIYYGPTGIERRIPKDCFLNLRDFGNFDELYKRIANMSESEHAAMIDAIERFINSPAADYFSAKNFTDILVKNILDANPMP